VEQRRASWTARWVASQRAGLHEQRPAKGDAAAELRLYEDLAIPLLSVRLAGATGMAARTRFIDDQLLRSVEGGVRQVVLVGAGYDGRALRFSDLPVRWIEVDHPATQADKRRRLVGVGAASERISFVPVDLLEGSLDAELARAGHDRAQPSLWVCEGLFPYLPRPTITALCGTLRSRSSPGSALVCNVLVNDSPRPLTRFVRKAVDGLLAAVGERRLSEFTPGDTDRLLIDTGWEIEARESTSPGRTDGTYLLAITAVPSS
jgi:methyltransferase (TIGR00027 family)